MPKYYHIHKGLNKSTLEKQFIQNTPLYFSKKNSSWYQIEQDISKDYGGFQIYEIYIPSNRFTNSFNPKTPNKIVKITKDNIKEYIDLREKYKGSSYFIEEMKKRKIIGIDATIEDKLMYGIYGPPEGYIWQKSNDIKIKFITIHKL